MNIRHSITILVLTFFFSMADFDLNAQSSSVENPVKIAFDASAKRVDLLTDEKIPSYTYAQRGSVRFYLWDINDPQDYLTYLHDGVRNTPIAELVSMEKVQQQFCVWILSFTQTRRNSPRVRELAVSFVPVTVEDSGGKKSYKSGERVHLLLNDLKKIEWGEVDKNVF